MNPPNRPLDDEITPSARTLLAVGFIFVIGGLFGFAAGALFGRGAL